MVDNFPFIDDFADDVPLGRVAGSRNGSGVVRGGVDVEGVIGVDRGGLRIQPLVKPGWGRAGISYGPFRREAGLGFAIHILNGHNTAQSGHLLQSIPQRFKRWILGSHTEHPITNAMKMVMKGDKRRQWRQIRRWVEIDRHHRAENPAVFDENLALGWFPERVPVNPVETGNAFVVHATGPENGELWATSGTAPQRLVRGLQNVPFYYLVILREKGAAYYAASLPGAFGMGAYPKMRPLAIEPFNEDQELYAAVWQSVMSQIGFWADTRVYGVGVARLDDCRRWYGTAETADPLLGNGDLDGTQAEVGGRWQVKVGRITRTPNGVRTEAAESVAVLPLGFAPGLCHMLLQGSGSGAAGFVWRWQDEANYWQVLVSQDGCRLICCDNGRQEEVAADLNCLLEPGRNYSLQVVENGADFAVYLDGRLLFDQWFSDDRLAGLGDVGISFCGPDNQVTLASFEVHPVLLPIPEALDFGPPWMPEPGHKAVVEDNFAGETAELTGRAAKNGRPWHRVLGNGRFTLSGSGQLAVDATASQPNPDRTAYTLPWFDPNYADVRVCILPPGMGRGEGERGRGGIIFWQDKDNYFIVSTWLDDFYEGASLSSFFYLNGYEDVFDAVWTNVGRRIVWGRPYHLRVAFDGLHYLVYLDNEPVLYRALTDIYPAYQGLKITQVGLVANWEWGNDTGSRFTNFAVFGKEAA